MAVVADIHLIGTAAARPAASSANNGYYYTATDTNGGTTYRSNATTWVQIAGPVTGGSVTSVAISGPSIISWSGTPITGAGTLTGTLANQSANQALAGPTSGGAAAPTFRSLVTADMPAAVGCRVYYNGSTSINNNTYTNFPNFDTEQYDTNAFHDLVTNPGRITIPAGLGGKYEIFASVTFASNATGFRLAYLLLNGATGIAAQTTSAVNGATTSICLSCGYSLSAGDYLEVGVYQNSGGALNVTLDGTTPSFGVTRIGS